jgi:hypothetical protein
VFKVDLHTHSVASPDGGISANQYAHALATGLLDVIAVTDHDQIDFALRLQGELGDRIIVGEEIMTNSGEIVGLHLTSHIKPGLSPLETVKQIKEQNGVVYIPHPFETVRKGLPADVLEELVDYIDIIEVCNGRAFLQNRHTKSAIFAKLHRLRAAASSDAHGIKGPGKTYNQTKEIPTRETLLSVIAASTPIATHPSPRALLYPKYHVIRKKLTRVKK